jgi:hypothetical protein
VIAGQGGRIWEKRYNNVGPINGRYTDFEWNKTGILLLQCSANRNLKRVLATCDSNPNPAPCFFQLRQSNM